VGKLGEGSYHHDHRLHDHQPTGREEQFGQDGHGILEISGCLGLDLGKVLPALLGSSTATSFGINRIAKRVPRRIFVNGTPIFEMPAQPGFKVGSIDDPEDSVVGSFKVCCFFFLSSSTIHRTINQQETRQTIGILPRPFHIQLDTSLP
jgi:hypothetical protein